MARKAGQIVKRGDRKFLVRIYLGTDGNGRRKYRNQTINGTKADAQKALNKMLREQDLGTLLEPTRMTLDEYLDHWLKTAVKPRVRPSTLAEYKATLRRYVREPLGAYRLQQVQPADVQAVYAAMRDQGISGSVRYVHTILRDALGQAVKWQMLARNPADYVDLPKRKSKSVMRAMTQDEVDRFLRAAQRSKWHPLFETLIATGLRPSEALALTWKDVDLGKATLTVRRSVRWAKRWVFSEPKTASSRRTLTLPHGLVSALSRHMETMRELGLPDLVFCGIDGEPVHQRGIVSDAFKPALERAGLPKSIRLYDLRHTHATLLLLAGVHAKVVAERLGHSSIKTTLDTYSHVLPGMQKEAAEKLDGLLYSTTPEAAHDAAN